MPDSGWQGMRVAAEDFGDVAVLHESESKAGRGFRVLAASEEQERQLVSIGRKFFGFGFEEGLRPIQLSRSEVLRTDEKADPQIVVGIPCQYLLQDRYAVLGAARTQPGESNAVRGAQKRAILKMFPFNEFLESVWQD